ncbi:SUKH-4 family immunity protein [Streptomyces sp. NPDC054863]
MRVDFGRERLGGAPAAAGVTLATEESLPGHSPSGETRAFLTEVGLPCEAPLMRFDLGGELRLEEGMLEIGVFTFMPSVYRILLDCRTGRVYVRHGREQQLLASDLSSLVHLCELVALLDPNEGRYARRDIECGPRVVAGLQRAMLELVGDTDPALLDTAEDISPYWRAAMTIRPLAWIAGPGPDGLAVDLRADVLGASLTGRYQHLAPFDEADLPAALTHAATRRYLRETGLADGGSAFITLDEGPLPTLAELYDHAVDDPVPPYDNDYGYVTEGDDYPRPPGAEHLIRLAVLGDDGAMLLDGATGRVYERFMPDGVEAPMNVDVSAYNFTVWLREQVVRLSGEHRLGGSYSMLTATVLDTFASVDSRACVASGGEEGYWPVFLGDESVSPSAH